MQARSADNVKGIDVSHWQGAVDWQKVAAGGIQFAFIKATEGKTTVDPQIKANAAGALNAGLKIGFYHYSHPESNDAVVEAANFAAAVKSYNSDFPHVLDVEGNASRIGSAALTAWCLKWLQEVNRLTGRPVMIYTGASFANTYLGKELGSYPLWIAHYGAAQPMPNGTWSKWSIFQYTDKGQVNGVSGNVDLDLMEFDFYNQYPVPAASPDDNVKIVVNGKLAAYGRIIGGHVYLPLRMLGQALGKTVSWDNARKLAYVEGKAVDAFVMIDGSAYVQIRKAAELFGGKLTWDNANKKVFLNI
ncbi:glycoside hydrolase [Paenibacillus sp. sptzw28]|uniref:GH25 family lysozyme n=1 Tax=Paenibacillus sp. sptzw28 TaxID=715179 RepID=UPI001C6ED4FA|nr:GH25 family lysozyme [Paenibacillus sp. sptzw28]QYR20769.1 glycoside hydrolase [Paenibacillus sp. sptzw28]